MVFRLKKSGKHRKQGRALRFLIFVVLIFSFLLAGKPSLLAAPLEENNRRVTILILDRLTLRDIDWFAGDYFRKIICESALALMNVRTARRRFDSGSGYITLGAGARGRGGEFAGFAFGSKEKHAGFRVREIYQRHTGKNPGGSSILHLHWPYLKMQNLQLGYSFFPGALGELLGMADKEVAVLGNADTEYPGRFAVTIAMDSSGRVRYGCVGRSFLSKDPYSPHGFHTDARKMWQMYASLPDKASLVVIDWGDTTRLDDYRKYLTPYRAEELLSEVFLRLDFFLKQLRPTLGADHLLIITAPSPAQRLQRTGKVLTPVLLSGGDLGRGLALSSTTRRPGLVTNLDLAPTVLRFLGVPDSLRFFGSSIGVQHGEPDLQFLIEKENRIALVYEQRSSLLRGYVLLQIIILLAALAGLLASFRSSLHLRYPLVLLVLVPFAFLLVACFSFYPFEQLALNFLAVFLTTTAATFLMFCARRRGLTFIFTAVGLLTAVFLSVDLLYGGFLLRTSFLGHDPIVGARFYGIGNEYMGVLVGSVILGTTSFISYLSKKKFKLLFFVPLSLTYLFVFFLLASPDYGANFGGALTAFISFIITLFVLLKIPINNLRFLLYSFVSLSLLMFFSLVILNTVIADEISHLGRMLELVRVEGTEEMFNTIRRKAVMNMRLIRYSIWSRILLIFLILQVVLFKFPVGVLISVRRKEPVLFAGFYGILAGSITALIVNDSGVVAAATLLLFGTVPMILLVLEDCFLR